MDKFNERFRQVLKDSGLTGAEISKLLGIHPPTLSKYIHGTSGMSLETLYRFCKTFNVSADWLLGLGEQKVIEFRQPLYVGLDVGNTYSAIHAKEKDEE